MFFMMLFTESTLSRLLSGGGAGSSSGLKEVVELEGLPVPGGRSGGGEGGGEANGDLIVFTKLFTLSRFREGEAECSEGNSWPLESGEKGERTGERNGEGSGMDIPWTEHIKQEVGKEKVKEALGRIYVIICPPRRQHASKARGDRRHTPSDPAHPLRITGSFIQSASATALRCCFGKSGTVPLPPLAPQFRRQRVPWRKIRVSGTKLGWSNDQTAARVSTARNGCLVKDLANRAKAEYSRSFQPTGFCSAMRGYELSKTMATFIVSILSAVFHELMMGTSRSADKVRCGARSVDWRVGNEDLV